ncbi:MAG: imidazolonepropionase-like amidohydrolase [Patiriisocius sp.]|jgi:imidazolonepropionase-like amidohydrolase
MNRIGLLVTLMVCALVASCAPDQPSEVSKDISDDNNDVIISNVTLIDAKQGLREDVTVTIRDDEIVDVSTEPSDPDAQLLVGQVIDGRGKYLIPGLWDMHVHLTYDDRFTELMPQTFLSWGITSVRDTGGMMQDLMPVIKKMRAPDAVSPRVYFSGPLLDGQHVVYDGNSRPLIGTQNSDVEQARENVRRLKKGGVDFIKIYELVSPEVFAALVDEAAIQSLPIASHVPLHMLASTVGNQVGTMEHLRNIELDCAANAEALLVVRREKLSAKNIESGHALRSSIHSSQRLNAIAALDEDRCAQVLAKLTETIQVPTLRLNALPLAPPYEQIDWDDALAAMLPEVEAEWSQPNTFIPKDYEQRDLRFSNYSLQMVQRMLDAGVPVGAGTDTPIGLAIPGYSLHRELEMLVRAGMTPLQALEASTIRPTEFFRIEDQLGTIEVGKRADLVLLSANPLEDIRNTRRIDLVISKGKIIQRGE